MSKEHSHNTLKIPLYGNCRVQNPDGTHIFNCGEKKAQWYLKRSLAEVITATPLVIRLNFVPNGKGHADDSFYLQDRQNICVCCGRLDSLTKHHVVPYCYRRFFPAGLKNHTAYDVLPLCYECHEKYETSAHKFKKQLTAEYDVPKEKGTVVDTELKNVCLAASALLRHKENIPNERYEYLIGTVRKYYEAQGQLTVDLVDIERAATLEYNTQRENYKPEGQSIVESLNDIEAFVKRWRQHFLDTMQPQHMPKYWVVERPL